MSFAPTEVVVIGGGQAGLAMSYYLTAQGRPHVVLEQDRIAESWRSRRWDSLRLIAPNWSLQLPGLTYKGDDPDGFMGKDEVADRLTAHAHSFGAPVREGVRVMSVDRYSGGAGFLLQTGSEPYLAAQVVIATGALQRPRVPTWAAELPSSSTQVIPYDYRNPQKLPLGAVLVVGSGQTGCQIAEELIRAGRTVFLAMSRSWWLPRRYRGLDASAWVRAIGWMERTADELPPGARVGQTNPQLTGGNGGHDISAHTLAREGVRLLGRLQEIRDGKAIFADDLLTTLMWGDEQTRKFLHNIDDHIRNRRLDAPAEDWPRDLVVAYDLAKETPGELDLKRAGISTVVWATGYRPDLGWVRLPILEPDGWPRQRRGVTEVPGLFILGLDWLHTAKSGLFAGVGEDAAYLASFIATEHAANLASI